MKKIIIGGMLISVLFLAGCASKNSAVRPSADNQNSSPAASGANPTGSVQQPVTANGTLDDNKFIEISAQMKCLSTQNIRSNDDITKFFQSFGITADTYYTYYSKMTARPDAVQIFTQVDSKYQAISTANQCYQIK